MPYRQKWPDNLLLFRHAESELNVARLKARAEGAHRVSVETREADIDLTENGVMQARKTGAYIDENFPKLDVILTSPYRRTLRTTEIIVEQLSYKLDIILEDRLRERELGIFDKLTSKGIKEAYPAEYERREREGKYYFRPLGGESMADVSQRVHSVLGTIVREYSKENVGVVSHSFVMEVFRKLLERMTEKEFLKMDSEEELKNCSILHYAYKTDKPIPRSHGKLVLQQPCYTVW